MNFSYPRQIRLPDGSVMPFINLDNAASTQPLDIVAQKTAEFLSYYSSVHRGSGYLSELSTRAFEEARQQLFAFVGASPELDTAIFVKNTTEAINKLANRFEWLPDDVVIISEMEHHSNDLPWRKKARVVKARVDISGALDLDDLRVKITEHAANLKLVAITGASNVTGYINDLRAIARLAHTYGAPLLVDAAQLAPHRRIHMMPHDHPEHLDFIAFSGHKMYAPFGCGVLIGPKEFFQTGAPDYCGGGTVRSVTKDSVIWAPPPERDEAGSPNVVGAVAMGIAAAVLSKTGMRQVALHEQRLLEKLLAGLRRIPNLTLYGSAFAGPNRLGVVAFNIQGLHHLSAARALAGEAGISVRNGCFCAHPYVHRLLDLSPEEIAHYSKLAGQGNLAVVPGMVRISIGLYNNENDIEKAIAAIAELAQNPRHYAQKYRDTAAFNEQITDPRRFFKV